MLSALRRLALLVALLPLAHGAQIPLVFIHGFKGARLVEKNGSVAWLRGYQAAGLSTRHLTLPLEHKGERQASDGLRPDDVLREVALIPGWLEEKVYGPWLDTANSSNAPFYAFAYDWRRDNLETVAQFEKYLDNVRAKNGNTRIRVVSHSMGGLITLALLNRRPELFASVVFAGVPFAGGLGFLEDMHAGAPIGINSRILAPEVLFTFPSVYALFPLTTDGIRAPGGAKLRVDFFAPESWVYSKLGVFANEQAPHKLALRQKFLEWALGRARRFREQLVARPVSYPPILVVVGTGHGCLERVIAHGPKSERGWDFKSAARGEGDGRVCTASGRPPQGIPFQELKTRADHANLLNEANVQHEVLKFGAR